MGSAENACQVSNYDTDDDDEDKEGLVFFQDRSLCNTERESLCPVVVLHRLANSMALFSGGVCTPRSLTCTRRGRAATT